MSCTRSPLWDEGASALEFQFDGAYAGVVSPIKGDARPTKRQPKRRGLWACFAQPLADEPVASFPLRASPSRLTLTAQQLAFRRTGSPEAQTQRFALSSIRDVKFKWIQAGGVRVSKVTLTLDSQQDPIIIRGLKNPEDLVEAVRKRQKYAVDHLDKLPEAEGRACDVPGTSPAGRWSEAPDSPAKRMTPRALFADATGSPASAANSGCGSMTLMSAFARSPAQDFAGADSVAREIQLASPGGEELSYSSSSGSTTPDTHTTPTRSVSRTPPATTTISAASRPSPPADARVVALRAVPPPRQPSDSFVLPPDAASQSGAAAAAQQQDVAGSGLAAPDEELSAGVMLTQHSPRGPARPSPRTAGGSPPSRAEDSVVGGMSAQLTPEASPRVAVPLMGGSPPPCAEDSMPEGASMPASVQGSPSPAPPGIIAGGSPPLVPEDSVVMHGGGASTPVSPLSSNAPGAAGRPLSPGALGTSGSAAALLRAASLPPLQAARPVDPGADAFARSASTGSASISAAPSPSDQPDAEVSFSDPGVSTEPLTRGSADPTLELPHTASSAAAAAASDSSASPAHTPRLLLPSLTRQRQHEGSHRLAHSSLALPPPAPRAGDKSLDGSAVPVERSDGGGSSFKSASSGELTDSSSAAATPSESPQSANAGRVAAAASSSPALVPGSGASGTPDRRSTSPMGILGIAAMSATVSAVLTSAASAGLGSVGLAAPALAGSAGVAVAGSAAAAASIAVAPLTLLGLTAAAAVTMVAAAAVTHIRTGSPLRPLDTPYSVYSLEGTAAPAEPLLAARTPASAGQVPESHGSWFGGNRGTTSSCGKAVSGGPPGSAWSAAGEAQSRVAAAQAALVTATVTIRDAGDDDSESATLLIDGGVAHACASPAPGLASEPSLSCDAGALSEAAGEHDSAAGCLSAASGASGATAASGSCDGSEEDAVTSGAWGSQPALADLEAEQAALASEATAAGPSAQGQAQSSSGGGCDGAAAAAATGSAEQQHPHLQHSEAEEEAHPVMLFSEGPGGMPPLARSAEQCAMAGGAAGSTAAQDAQGQQQSASVGAMPPSELDSASASTAAALGGNGDNGGQCLQPAARVVHGGELCPPPPPPPQSSVRAAAEPEPVGSYAYAAVPLTNEPHQAGPASRRDPTVRQLFRDDDDAPAGAPSAPNHASSISSQSRQQQQQEESEEEAVVSASSCAPLLPASPPLAVAATNASPLPPAAVGGLPPDAAPSATQQRRAQHLTESPVRVLYSVHAAFTGLPSADPRVRHVEWGPGPSTCESTAQTDAPVVSEGRSRSEVGDGAKNSSGVSTAALPYSDAAQPLMESALQRVFTLDSPQASSCGGGTAAAADGKSAVSVAVGADSAEDGPSPPQAGAQDWYMSSVGADPQLGSGFELVAASVGHPRHGPPASPSTADGSAYSSSSPSGSSPAAWPSAPEGCANSPQASQHQASRSSAWSQPVSMMPLVQESTHSRAIATANEEEAPLLLGCWRSGVPDSRAGAGQLARERELQHGGMHSVDQVASLSRSTSPSQTLSPSASGSSVPPSASISSGLYTPMLSDASSSKGTAGAPLGHSPVSITRPAAATHVSPRGSEGAVVCVIGRWRTQAASPAAGAGGSSVDEVVSERDSLDPQRRLLTPGLRLFAEPPTPLTQRNPADAASLGASSPSVSNAQDGNAQDGNAQDAREVSTVAAEQASPLTRVSDTEDDMVWLLPPVAGGHAIDGGADGATASAPASPRIPPPPPLAHSNPLSRGSSAHSRRMTSETEGSLGGAAGCCSSRRSSSGSCGDQADPARLAWCVSRGSAQSFGGHGGLAQAHPGPALGSWSDGNQLARALSSGACGSAAERRAAAHPPGLQARAGSSRDIDDSIHRLSGSSHVTPGSSMGPTGAVLQGALGAVDSPPGCSGGSASSGSQTSSSPPHTPSGALGAASQAATPALSPDLSEISSAAYAGGAYVYGSLYGSPTTDAVDGSNVGPDAGAAAGAVGSTAADGGEGDDLFHNPLYSAPGKDTAGRSRPARDSSGCISLPLMPYSESLAYGGMDGTGGGTSTCTTSPDPASTSQPNLGSELPANAGRRRTREETSSYLYDDGSVQCTAAAPYGTGAGEARSAASRQASVDGGGSSTVAATAAGPRGSEWGAFASPPEDSAATEGGGSGAEAQPLKRARTQLPTPEVVTAVMLGPVGASLGTLQQQPQLHAGRQASTPAPPQGAGGAAPAPGLPLVSPLMVLNPTYSRSAGGSPAVTSTPPAAARSDDTSAAHADAARRHGLALATKAEAVAAAGRKVDGGGGVMLAEGPGGVDRQLVSLQTTPRNRELTQLQEGDWGSSQGSPSSQQAAHAAVLLRHANDAVDFARDAVQRGDEQWLSRVTATLQAVQSALDALHDF